MSKTSLPSSRAPWPPHSRTAPGLQLLRRSEELGERRPSIAPQAGTSAAACPVSGSACCSALQSYFCKYPSNRRSVKTSPKVELPHHSPSFPLTSLVTAERPGAPGSHAAVGLAPHPSPEMTLQARHLSQHGYILAVPLISHAGGPVGTKLLIRMLHCMARTERSLNHSLPMHNKVNTPSQRHN